MTLNLEAKNKQEELVLAYLQENASQTLADKINNGTPFEKDGKPLRNKKTLSGFMKYACEEARKLAEKGANSACIDSDTVFGWAIHYFEEDSIEGSLLNQDNTPYKPKSTDIEKLNTSKNEPKEEPKPQDQQASIFDILDGPFNVSVNIPNLNKFEPKVENKTEPKQDNKYLHILNEILGGIVKEY